MYTSAALVFLHAETAVHAGSGEAFGAVDLAIQRERHTDLPIVRASGVKGAVRDWFARKHPPVGEGPDRRSHPTVAAVFGPDTRRAADHAGAVTLTDARTLLFPVRSARGVFAYVTCPDVIDRLRRDLALVGDVPDGFPPTPTPPAGYVYATGDCSVSDDEGVMLEEYTFKAASDIAVSTLADWLRDTIVPDLPEYEPLKTRLPGRLLVLRNDDFTDFVRHATEVQARVALNDKKTTTGDGGNLFYQENLPADTVLYSAVLAGQDLSRDAHGNRHVDDVLAVVRQLDGKRLQLGGDETIGKGICCTRFFPPAPQSS